MFSFEDLEQLESYQDKIEYAKKHLNLIGAGRRRTVFEFDSYTVLKFANNEDGIISNNVEKHYSDYGWKRLAAVLDYDEDFMWIKSERAQPIDEKKFKELCGINSSEFYTHLYHYANQKMLSLNSTVAYSSNEYNQDILAILDQGKNTAISSEINLKSEELGFKSINIAFLENLGVIERDGKETVVVINYGGLDTKFRKYPLKTSG